MDLVKLLSTTVLAAVAGLDKHSILQGRRVAGRMSSRKRFPRVDFYGNELMSCGLLGHRHTRAELAVVTEGSLNVGIGDYLYEAHQGDWLLFPGEVIHGECALPSRRTYRLLWLIPGDRGLRHIHFTNFGGKAGYTVTAHFRFDSWPADLRGAWRDLIEKPWDDPAALRVNLARQVCHMMTQIAAQAPTKPSTSHPMVRDVQRMLNQHKGRRPTVVDLADAVGLSPNYLSNLFHRETGIHLHTFIDQQRIERAKQMLSDTPMSVKQVAFNLAFADPQHFSRVFRRVTGVSPSTFQQQARS